MSTKSWSIPQLCIYSPGNTSQVAMMANMLLFTSMNFFVNSHRWSGGKSCKAHHALKRFLMSMNFDMELKIIDGSKWSTTKLTDVDVAALVFFDLKKVRMLVLSVRNHQFDCCCCNSVIFFHFFVHFQMFLHIWPYWELLTTERAHVRLSSTMNT